MQIAFYKGPPKEIDRLIGHWGIRAVMTVRDLQVCPYSHIELVINGLCHSSSAVDVMTEGPRKGKRGGPRIKLINLTDGKWDVFPVRDGIHEGFVKRRFLERMAVAQGYDYPAGARWALPFIKARDIADNCLEICAHSLGASNPSDWTFRDILNFYCET